MSQVPPIIAPSSFVVEWLPRVRRGRALDVAAGRGRHALPMARSGFTVFGVDRDYAAVHDLAGAAIAEGLPIRVWCADLTRYPLPDACFDLVVVTRYLQRDLFAPLGRCVRPGGAIVYETFTTGQRALGTGPRSPDHLLEPGELRTAFAGFSVRFYEEASSPEAVARLVAERIP